MNHQETQSPIAPPPRIALLACDVLEGEIALLTRGASHIMESRLFEIFLHDRSDHLRATLQENLDAVDARTDIDAVVLVYGLCGRGTVGLRLRRHKLVIPRAHDCITLFMGSKEAYADHQRRCPSCYYYTPGWNQARRVPGPEMFEAMRDDLATRYDEDDLEFLLDAQRELYAQHDTATYINLGTDNAAEEAAYARHCADWLGWKFEQRPGDPALLRDLLWGNWDSERFLVIDPGQQVGQAADESIMRADPVPTPRA